MDDKRPSFAALLRGNLPVRPAGWLPYVVVAFVLRFFFTLSLTVTAVVTGITIPVSIVVFTALEYALSRLSTGGGGDPGGW